MKREAENNRFGLEGGKEEEGGGGEEGRKEGRRRHGFLRT